MEVKSCLVVFLLIAVMFSELNLTVQAAKSEPLSPSDSIRFQDISNELKVFSRKSQRIPPPPPKTNPPIHMFPPPTP
ncbi:hypothetical protein HRI_002132600 [Hibiscus trionum]|uniref:Transmembrane protein n=1 Tax=Hibiscus trionum TaxID=183268 RepID=A0A9W7M1V9_HIBTR|nr:hypothetical protein HRI_002132600 [Hibiscus trionum]